MSTAAIQFSPLCVDYHYTMAALAATGQSVLDQASLLFLARHFWESHRSLKALLRDLNSVESRRDVPPEGDIVRKLRDVHCMVNRVLDFSGKNGLTRRPLISRSIQSLRASNEELLDFVERFELALDPSVAIAVQDAIDEYHRGETVSLDSL
jgi:hypothetical protein